MRWKVTIAGLPMLILVSSCTRQTASPVLPPAPAAAPTPSEPPANPTPATITEFTAEPSSIVQGESATLRWHVAGDVTSVTLDPVGAVDKDGRRGVSPANTTTYKLIAIGRGYNKTASLVVRVVPALPPVPSGSEGSASRSALEERLSTDLPDVYFDYDSTSLSGDARENLTRIATALKSIIADFPSATVFLEGHCDERGSAEYNLALGALRAGAAKDFLVQMGVSPDRVALISFGKEKPQCIDSAETCWQQNRRVHFAPGQ